LAEYNPKLQDVSAATRVAYAKFKTKMLMSQIKEGEDDSEPATPVEHPKVNAETRAAKSQSLRLAKRATIVKQQQAQAAAGTSKASRKLAKGVSLDPAFVDKQPGDEELTTGASADPLPILKTIHKEIEKVKEAGGSKKEKRKSPSPPLSQSKAGEESKKDGGEPSSPDQSTPSAKKTEFTVVQIETTKQPIDTEPEEPEPTKDGSVGEKEKPGTSKKAASKSPSPTTSEELEQGTKKAGEKERKSSAASVASLPAPAPPPRSPSPTGKSAVTGQTRTGWI